MLQVLQTALKEERYNRANNVEKLGSKIRFLSVLETFPPLPLGELGN